MCLLKVGVLGLNHKTADLALRESVSKGAEILAGQKAIFFPYPTVLLSTCNRTEVYFSADNLVIAHTDLLALLRSAISESFEHRLYSYFHADCFAHLCSVTAGLDSVIWAETEIQRQVKVAYGAAMQHLALPSCMHYMFQKALKVGKEIRQSLVRPQTATLSGTLYAIAKKFWGSLDPCSILLVGYSEVHRSLAAFLKAKGHHFHLATKHPERVRLEGATLYGYESLQHWQKFDLICLATRSPTPLIFGSSVRRHLIFDLSLPRLVDPEVAKGEVTLINLEQIHRIIEKKQEFQKEPSEHIEQKIWNRVVQLARIFREKSSFHRFATQV